MKDIMWVGDKNEVSDGGQNELDIQKQWVEIYTTFLQMIWDILPFQIQYLSKI